MRDHSIIVHNKSYECNLNMYKIPNVLNLLYLIICIVNEIRRHEYIH